MTRQGSARTQTLGATHGLAVASPGLGGRCHSCARLGPGANASRPISQRLVARWSKIYAPLLAWIGGHSQRLSRVNFIARSPSCCLSDAYFAVVWTAHFQV